ncbi:hypothetical protein GEMRC1_006027 [Eukaryota sp. GEM-RC1]
MSSNDVVLSSSVVSSQPTTLSRVSFYHKTSNHIHFQNSLLTLVNVHYLRCLLEPFIDRRGENGSDLCQMVKVLYTSFFEKLAMSVNASCNALFQLLNSTLKQLLCPSSIDNFLNSPQLFLSLEQNRSLYFCTLTTPLNLKRLWSLLQLFLL